MKDFFLISSILVMFSFGCGSKRNGFTKHQIDEMAQSLDCGDKRVHFGAEGFTGELSPVCATFSQLKKHSQTLFGWS